MTKDEWYRQLFEHLGNSKFRSSFHLGPKEIAYIHDKGLDTIREHARDFIAKREAPAHIPNDGRQTPMKGHPVFIAQKPVIKASICNGEQVAGFKDIHTGKIEEIMLIKCPEDMERFKEIYGMRGISEMHLFV